MTNLLVNCHKMHFASTLGVAHALLQLTDALAADHQLTFAVNDLSAIDDGPAAESIRAMATQVIDVDSVRSLGDDIRRSWIELLPHHFQSPEFCDRSIMMCFDLHVFDVPWKYGDRATGLQTLFRRNLVKASAVMTVFPRTYYAVERAADISINNLFLTESPLLLDLPGPVDPPSTTARSRSACRLLYPAQLQLNKNHDALARGVARVRRRGADVKIICPGSDLNDDTTDHIKSLIDELGVADAFEFPGRVSDDALINLYRQCDAVIVPSVAEGGAYVPLEAIAFGKPVAVNEIEAARMHIDSMQGEVIWFDATDPDETADAMQALTDADALEWFYKNARCREQIETATWESVASKWNAVIAMLEGRRPRPVVATDRHASEIAFV